MKIFTCPDCGKEFQGESAPIICPNCACPSDHFKVRSLSSNVSPSLESSNDFGAEHVVNGLAIVNLGLGVIIGLGGIITGIVILVDGSFGTEIFGIILLIVGPLIFLVCLIFWAVLKLLVNISYRLTRLDNKSNPQ